MLRFVSMLALVAVAPVAIGADVPTEINHQGVITVNDLRFTGDGHFYFALVDPDTETNLWTSDGTNLAPSSDRPISPVHLDDIVNGVYSVRLGSTDAVLGIAMPPIPPSVFNDDNVVLRIWFDDLTANGIQQLSPDQALTTSPYAFRAAKADNVDHLVIPESTTTALAVDAQGNVGIGTSTPAAELDVVGDVAVSGTVDGVDVSGHAADANAHHTPPTSLVPSGPAGGGLSGDYPNPVVADDSHSHTDSTVSDDLSINNGRLFAPRGSGNVGIGTTSPGYGDSRWLELNATDAPRPIIRLFRAGPTPLEYLIAMEDADNNLRIVRGDGSSLPRNLTSGIIIGDTGNVGIRTLPSSAMLNVGHDTGTISLLIDTNHALQAQPLVRFRSTEHDVLTTLLSIEGDSDADAGGPWQAFSVHADGRVESRYGLIIGPSDARLKRNVVSIPNALKRVLALRGINFKWKDSHVDGDSLQLGLIAQEVEKVFPEAVHTADDTMGTKAVEYEHLVAALVEAIKELNGIVKQQDAELAGERARIDALESRLVGLEARLPELAQTEMNPSMP